MNNIQFLFQNLQNPLIGSLVAPAIALERISKNEAFKALPEVQRKRVLDIAADCTRTLFHPNFAPLTRQEQLLYYAKCCSLQPYFATPQFLVATQTVLTQLETIKGMTREERVAREKEELRKRVPADCPQELYTNIETLACRLLEKKLDSGFENELLALKKPLFEGSFQERFQALIQLCQLNLTRKAILEDETEGYVALDFMIELANGRTTSQAELKATTEKGNRFYSNLLQLLAPGDAQENLFAPMLHMARRIEDVKTAVAAEAALAPTSATTYPFPEFLGLMGEIADPLPAELNALIGEYHYTTSEAIKRVDADTAKLPPQWQGRLKSESIKDVETNLDLSNSALTFAKLKRLAAECIGSVALKLDVTNATLSGKPVFNASALQYFFTALKLPRERITGLPCASQDQLLALCIQHREATGLSEEEMWTLAVTLHAEQHTENPVQAHPENDLAWRVIQHQALMKKLQKLCEVFFG